MIFTITKPPGWVFLIGLLAPCLLVLYWASVPFWYRAEILLVGVFVLGPLVLIYIGRLIAASLKGQAGGRPWRWLAAPLIVWVMLLSLVTDAPFQLRFAISLPEISLPEMEAYAATVKEQSRLDAPCEWVGLYRVCYSAPHYVDSEPVPGSAYLGTEEWVIDSNTGFLMVPHGEPEAETIDDEYRHVGGRWFGHHGWDNW
ncbi:MULTISPECIES: hypothetical protein [Nonomuraea]|uniref:DUF1109 domain-containing protein n=1 Tax=Nonomuraea ferruginea TaxID=46174 RepID=A0ABT4SZU1_9ACTN|nr:hypothetical protein [Nonomuraea ferruginea]MDA0642762.1 hypothetical protein [Nonomuraea ferruginea]